jgi:hypothetical protein
MPSIRQPGRRPLRVFLSYRRQDASGHAGRLYDLLVARYGAERIFMDIDAVPVGSDFDAAISRAMASCDVFIALIGRRWLQATDADGRRRLDDPDDYVRREIESALTQGVIVVPTCVQGAEIPRSEDLPPSLVPLTRRQGFHLSDAGWQDDARRLFRRLEAVERERSERPVAAARPAPARRRRRPGVKTLAVAALGCVALAGVLAAVLFGGGGGGDGESSTPAASETTPQPSGVSRARGTVTLGSDLRSPAGSDRWYCTGSGADSPPCSFVLTRLPEVDRPVTAPFDGVVTHWQVQWARGPMRLIVVRGDLKPGARSILARVGGSAEREVPSTARHDFRTRVRIRRGDAVGLQFSVGAYGSAPYSDGTSLERWSPPLGPERRPSDSGGAQTYELLYNAIVERDRDGDGYGDVTQDRCPRDPRRHAGC